MGFWGRTDRQTNERTFVIVESLSWLKYENLADVGDFGGNKCGVADDDYSGGDGVAADSGEDGGDMLMMVWLLVSGVIDIMLFKGLCWQMEWWMSHGSVHRALISNKWNYWGLTFAAFYYFRYNKSNPNITCWLVWSLKANDK